MIKTILITTEFFYPAFKAGGPTKSILNLVNFLKDKYKIKIICSSKDLKSIKNHEVKEINKWYEVNGYSIIYCDSKIIAMREIFISRWKIKYDYLYLGSFFNPVYSLYSLLTRIGSRKKIIIAPKGEFFQGAFSQKIFKKIIIIYLFKIILRFWNIKWHSTSENEKQTIQNILNNKKLDIIISSNLVNLKKFDFHNKHKKQKHINILICGRISPVKNILMSLDCISELKGNVNVEIWGQIDDHEYWSKCLKKINNNPKNINILYKGVFHPKDIKNVFDKHHVLLMPSLSENFGYVIFESFNHGVPVITSKNTPWKNLNRKEIGFDIALSNQTRFVKSLQIYENMKNSELTDIQKKCKNYALSYSHLEMKKTKSKLLCDLFK